MQDDNGPAIPSLADIRTRVHDAARLLRNPTSLDPQVRRALADLVDELGQALETPNVPPNEVALLAECTTHLAQALNQAHDQGLLERARDRIKEASLQMETRAPTTVHLVEKLINALASIGI